MLTGADTTPTMVDFGQPGAAQHLIGDVVLQNGGQGWVWTRQNPSFHVHAVSSRDLTFLAEFALWDVAFKQTGPVTLSFFVNGHKLGDVQYDSPGQKHYAAAIPPGWVSTEGESTVSIRIDKLWVSPEDGEKFGFILRKIGFTR